MKKIKAVSENLINSISEKTKLGKKPLLCAALLVAGIVLLVISEAATPSEQTSVPETTTSYYNEDIGGYAYALEERLTSIISRIEGVGETKVMVTLESSSEDIYLHNYDYGENVEPSGKSNIEQKDEYVIVEDKNGEKGIVVRVAQPKVRGVAVVCEGGGSQVVKSRITETVTALLDISAARVSVSEMG